MSEATLSQQDFHHELVNRFFHTSSYFYNCLSSEIERVLEEVDSHQKQHYLLMGTLLDKLVAAENAVDELEILNRVSGFGEFYDKINRGTEYLYTADLDSDRLKVEIESLAHSMFNSALLAFQDEGGMNQLRLYLGHIDEPEEPRPFVEPVSQVDDVPLEAAAGSEREVVVLQEDDPGEAIVDAPETATEVHAETKDESELVTDERVGVVVDEVVEEAKSPPSREPGSLIGLFDHELQALLQKLDAVVNASGDATLASVDQGREIVDSLAMAAMIYGFEAFEQLALKTRQQVDELRSVADAEPSAIMVHLLELRDLMTALRERELDSIDIKLVQQLSRSLRDKQEDPIPAEEMTEPVPEQTEDLPAILDPATTLASTPDSGLSEELTEVQPAVAEPGEPEVSPLDEVAVVHETSFAGSEVSVPGTDMFEDIAQSEVAAEEEPLGLAPDGDTIDKSLIASVVEPETESRAGQPLLSNEEEPEEDPVEIPGAGDDELLGLIADINNPGATPASESDLELAPEGETLHQAGSAQGDDDPAVIKVDTGEPDQASQYTQKASIYFNVIGLALDSLEANDSQTAALEDIELAASALYGLALKAGLTKVGALPDVLASTIETVLANDYVLTSEDRAGIRDVFQEFTEITSNEAADSQRFKELLTAIGMLRNRADYKSKATA